MKLMRFALVYLATPKLHRTELLPNRMSPAAEIQPNAGQRVAQLSVAPQVQNEHALTAYEADRAARRDAKLARSGIAADLLLRPSKKPGGSQTENLFPQRSRGAPHERRYLKNDPDRLIPAGLRKFGVEIAGDASLPGPADASSVSYELPKTRLAFATAYLALATGIHTTEDLPEVAHSQYPNNELIHSAKAEWLVAEVGKHVKRLHGIVKGVPPNTLEDLVKDDPIANCLKNSELGQFQPEGHSEKTIGTSLRDPRLKLMMRLAEIHLGCPKLDICFLNATHQNGTANTQQKVDFPDGGRKPVSMLIYKSGFKALQEVSRKQNPALSPSRAMQQKNAIGLIASIGANNDYFFKRTRRRARNMPLHELEYRKNHCAEPPTRADLAYTNAWNKRNDPNYQRKTYHFPERSGKIFYRPLSWTTRQTLRFSHVAEGGHANDLPPVAIPVPIAPVEMISEVRARVAILLETLAHRAASNVRDAAENHLRRITVHVEDAILTGSKTKVEDAIIGCEQALKLAARCAITDVDGGVPAQQRKTLNEEFRPLAQSLEAMRQHRPARDSKEVRAFVKRTLEQCGASQAIIDAYFAARSSRRERHQLIVKMTQEVAADAEVAAARGQVEICRDEVRPIRLLGKDIGISIAQMHYEQHCYSAIRQRKLPRLPEQGNTAQQESYARILQLDSADMHVRELRTAELLRNVQAVFSRPGIQLTRLVIALDNLHEKLANNKQDQALQKLLKFDHAFACVDASVDTYIASPALVPVAPAVVPVPLRNAFETLA